MAGPSRQAPGVGPADAGAARHRLFFALWPGEGVRASLSAAAGGLRSAHPVRGRWLAPQRYHLTLRFLGDCDGARESAALRAGAMVRAAGFDLAIDRAGSFGGRSIPWWLGCGQLPPALRGLADALDAALRLTGLGVQPGPAFVPHVTVLRDAQARLPDLPIAPVSWPVRDFVLVHSVPGSQSGYHVLARWPLRAPP